MKKIFVAFEMKSIVTNTHTYKKITKKKEQQKGEKNT